MKRSLQKYIIPVIILFVSISSLGCSSNQTTFTITNNSEINRVDEPIVLTREMIEAKSGAVSGKLPLPYTPDGFALPAQVDDLDKDGSWDELAFTLDIPANQSQEITIRFVEKEDYPNFEPRTNVRFGVLEEGEVKPVKELTLAADELPVPPFGRFQMDGPAWENDKVGFRQYIDGRNGRDLYGKTTSEMALDTVGISDEGLLEDNYHVMLPWGRDILAVGNSLGLGGLGILRNDEPVRLGIRIDAQKSNVAFTHYELLTEGPVRSIFRLTYKGWNTGTDTVTLINDVSIWAGTYSHINEVELQSPNEADTLVAGLVNIHNDNPPTLLEGVDASYSAFYTHDKQTYDKGWFLGMGLIFPSQNYLGYRETPDSGPGITNSFLNLFELGEGSSLKYHVFAGWELSDEKFTDADYFDDFIIQEIQKISNPVSIE